MATYDASVTLEAQSSATSGISERTVGSSVVIASDSSVASGVSERELVAGNNSLNLTAVDPDDVRVSKPRI